MEINKLYIKVGTYTNEETKETINNCILGYFICFDKIPKYRACGCNFDESKDFENAIIIDQTYLDKIIVNKSQFINGKVVANGTI